MTYNLSSIKCDIIRFARMGSTMAAIQVTNNLKLKKGDKISTGDGEYQANEVNNGYSMLSLITG